MTDSRPDLSVNNMYLYIDESIHNNYGFMVIAYVLCEINPQSDLAGILAKYDMEEFHACTRMESNTSMQSLRNEFASFVNSKCYWGVLVLPSDSRSNLSDDIKSMLDIITRDVCRMPLDVFIDEGIIDKTAARSMCAITDINSASICSSRDCKGIQLADLVAALSGIRLKEEIGNNPKMLSYGEAYGYAPPIEAELGFELWATLRYSMLRQSTSMGDDMPEMAMFPTLGYGLFISPKCSNELSEKADKVFGSVYLGCIH